LFNELTVGMTVAPVDEAIAIPARPDPQPPQPEASEAPQAKSDNEAVDPAVDPKAQPESVDETAEAPDETPEAAPLGEIESSILTFLTDKGAASLSEIESELSLTRFKAVDALRSLIEAGHLRKESLSGKPATYHLSAD